MRIPLRPPPGPGREQEQQRELEGGVEPGREGDKIYPVRKIDRAAFDYFFSLVTGTRSTSLVS